MATVLFNTYLSVVCIAAVAAELEGIKNTFISADFFHGGMPENNP
jgi:hypothetical protein